MKELYLREEFQRAWAGQDPFRQARALDGEIFRALEQRKTLRFTLGGASYFVKMHQGASWREIVKNLLQLRRPVVSAHNERVAIAHLQSLGEDTLTVAAYGRRGWRPGNLESFLITEDLGQVQSLEALCADWPRQPPAFAFKLHLLHSIARISRRMHGSGMCHRDFYICHFLLSKSDARRLYLIDLHRALVKHRLARRWKVKDVAGLYFSSMDIGLSQRDLFRFMKVYSGKNLRETLQADRSFWDAVYRKAWAIKNRELRKARSIKE